MNLFLAGTIIFVIIYLFLHWLAKTSSKKIAHFLKRLAVFLSIGLAALLAFAGKFLFSLPFLLILLTGLKIKGLTAFQMIQLWRLIQFMRSSGRFSQTKFGQTKGSSNITVNESYKLLGLKKGCSKNEVMKSASKLQKKIFSVNSRDVMT